MEGPSLLRDCKISISAKVRLKLYQPHTFWPMLASDLILDSSSCSHFLPMWKLFCVMWCVEGWQENVKSCYCVSPLIVSACLCNPRCGDGDVTRPYNTHETAHCPYILPTPTHTREGLNILRVFYCLHFFVFYAPFFCRPPIPSIFSGGCRRWPPTVVLH